MEPIPPPRQYPAQYPRPGNIQIPTEPFGSDKAYVWIDAITTALGFVILFALWPTVLDQSMKEMRSPSGPTISKEFMQGIFVMVIGLTIVIMIPLEYFILSGIWKGKRWAFIVSLCLLLLGLLSNLSNFGMILWLSIYSLILSLGKVGYCIARLSGRYGPSLT